MWKKILFTMWFQDFVTVFNQSYNCQTSHCLGRNRPLNARLSILLFDPCLKPIVLRAFTKSTWNQKQIMNQIQQIQVILLASLPILRRRQNVRYSLKAATGMALACVRLEPPKRLLWCRFPTYVYIVTQQRPSPTFLIIINEYPKKSFEIMKLIF